MRIKISQLRKFIREAIEVAQEDLDRVHRAKDGYGDSMFDESLDSELDEDHTAHSKESRI